MRSRDIPAKTISRRRFSRARIASSVRSADVKSTSDSDRTPTQDSGLPNGPSAPLDGSGSCNESDPSDHGPASPGKATPIVRASGEAECRFRLTWYDGDGTRPQTREATWAEVQELDPREYDAYESEPEGLFGIRTADGEWHPIEDDWPGSGPEALLHAIQARPGAFLTPDLIAEATGVSTFRNNGATSTNLMKLRAFLREKGKPSWLVRSRRKPRFSISWNSARRYMRVEYLQPKAPGMKR